MNEIVVPAALRSESWGARLVRIVIGIVAASLVAPGLLLSAAAALLPRLPWLVDRIPPSQMPNARVAVAGAGVMLLLFAVMVAAVGWLLVRFQRAQKREFVRVVTTSEPQRARLEIQYDYDAESYRARLFHPGRDECFREFTCSLGWGDEAVIHGSEVEAYVDPEPGAAVAVKTSRGWIWSLPVLSLLIGRKRVEAPPFGC